MGLDIRNSGDVFLVSDTAQTNAETAQTASFKALEFDEASTITNNDNRVNNQSDKTGEVEPTEIQTQDKDATGTLTQAKATPDGVGWAMRFLIGAASSSTVGGTVERHIFKSTSYPANPAYFTAIHRKGGSGGSPADLRLNYGLGLNTVSLAFAKGEFASLALGVLGTGRNDDLKTHEVISGLDNATTLVVGAEILDDVFAADSVIIWADQDGDGQYETPVEIVSYNQPTLTFTITSLGGAGATINYRASYYRDHTEAGYGWADLSAPPAVATEFKLKAANSQIIVGGRYTEPGGVPTFTGGQVAGCEIENLTWEWNWNGEIGKCWRQGSVEEDFATSVDLKDPLQTIEMTRRVRDYLMQANFSANTPLGLYIDAVGEEIDGTQPGELFHVKLFFPKVGILANPLQVSDTRWVEAGSLQVLKDTSGDDHPTVICQVQNEVAAYA